LNIKKVIDKSTVVLFLCFTVSEKKNQLYFIVKKVKVAQRRVLEVIPVFGSQPAGDVSHKPAGRLPLLSIRLAVIHATLKRATTSFAGW